MLAGKESLQLKKMFDIWYTSTFQRCRFEHKSKLPLEVQILSSIDRSRSIDVSI